MVKLKLIKVKNQVIQIYKFMKLFNISNKTQS